MPRKFTRSCPKGGTCLSDVIIAEFAIGEGEITRASILKQLPSLKLTPRQASYRLAYLVKNGTLIKMGTGRNTCYRINREDRKITHLMHLNKMPFELIKSGQKKVEMRLNDKKRKYIEKGVLTKRSQNVSWFLTFATWLSMVWLITLTWKM